MANDEESKGVTVIKSERIFEKKKKTVEKKRVRVTPIEKKHREEKSEK